MHSYIVKYRYPCGEWTTETHTCLVNVPILANRTKALQRAEDLVAEKCPHKDKPGFKITSVTGPVTETYNA
jgi:hypothetical protein